MHKLHVLQYPGLSNVSPLVTHSHSLTHSLAHTFAFSPHWKVEFRLEVLLIGCEAAVASSVYTSLERRQH